MNLRNRSGATLLELLCGLSLLGVLLGMVAIPAAHAGDVLAVGAARTSIMAAASAARALATGHGGAELQLHPAGGVLSVITSDGRIRDTLARLGETYGVTLELGTARADGVSIRFDGLGIGRLANRTVQIRRGRVSGGVTFSAYGRARPW